MTCIVSTFCLLKDGLVSRASFSNLIDEAAAMPRAYGYAPSDSDLWKNQQDKDASRQKMFDSMDLVSFNLLRVQTWLFCLDLSCNIILISQHGLDLVWSDVNVFFSRFRKPPV